MKNETNNCKLLQRGNVSRPKKDMLIAEAKLAMDVKIPEVIEVQLDSKLTSTTIPSNTFNEMSSNKQITKTKSINRLFNSVKKLNGKEQKLVYNSVSQFSQISEAPEEVDYNIEITPADIPIPKENKPFKIKKSLKIQELAKKWENKNNEPDPIIDEKDLEEKTSLKSNPKMLKRLYNTKKRLLGIEN